MAPTDRRSRRRRSRVRSLLFGIAVAAIVIWLGEVGLRLGGVQPAYSADAVGGWRMQPKVDGQRITAREGNSFVLSTNADGLRTSARKARTPGVRRVVVMGDSTVFGWGVDDGDTFPDALGTALGPGTEVINAGQPGYSTTQMVGLFERSVAAFAPDLLVVFVPMHDDNRVLVSDREHLDGARGFAQVRVILANHSRFYQTLRSRIFPRADEAYLVPGRDRSLEPRVPRVSPVERDANFERIRQPLERAGGKLAVGHLPFLADLLGEMRGERFSGPWARDYEAATGTPILDLRGCCTGSGGEALVLPTDPGHLNAEGNERVGRAAAPRVAALLGG
ncbi:MAG: hypothetical protein EXR71_00190 [Myxococcales bacterium]|nr:hypothetical protein [Myxococcales bacterium]